MPKTRAAANAVLERSPSHLLHRVLQVMLDIYAEEAGPSSVTQRQYAVLSAVGADEGLSQTELVRATGIDRSTLADLVARMIGRGLLARERSAADARANTVRLTEQGREALAAVAPRVAAADRRLLSLLGSKKRDAFLDGLRRLSKAGEEALLPEAAAPVVKARKRKGDSEDEEGNGRRAKSKKEGKGAKKKRRREKAQDALAGAEPPTP